MRTNPYRWTHPSVIGFAGTEDPVGAMIDKARSAVYAAVVSGWAGPPFDPIALAEMLGIRVLPREDVTDARTIPIETSKVRIEFNPSRPRGRMRYSIAHELAHTFFPDCAERVRNRVLHENLRQDEWQLETLCNIGAAELLMPVGSFPELKRESLTILNILPLQRRYDVSVEALLLRIAKLTEEPCAVFCASSKGVAQQNYKIDYAVPSASWSAPVGLGTPLPADSMLSDVTAIGFTSNGDESWGEAGKLHIECVGIPPYPKHRFPRVAGLLSPLTKHAISTKHIEYVKGDATQPRGTEKRIVAHVVNDRSPLWGAGFGLAVRRKWPTVQKHFQRWATQHHEEFRLGSTYVTPVDGAISVAHMICQHGLGPSRTARIRYGSLEKCLVQLAAAAISSNASIHIPRIGCGEAGGSWEIVSELVQYHLCNKNVSVVVYDLPDQSLPHRSGLLMPMFSQPGG